jgi:hypothetical protein
MPWLSDLPRSRQGSWVVNLACPDVSFNVNSSPTFSPATAYSKTHLRPVHKATMKTRASSLLPRLLVRRPQPSSYSHPPASRLHSTAPPRGPPGSPLRLSADEQRIFDELVRRASAPPPPPTPSSAREAAAAADPAGGSAAQETAASSTDAAQPAEDRQQQLHPDTRKGAAPEFEGDVNTRTGEVGGPKNEPLRWGAGGDWSFNGRATDF